MARTPRLPQQPQQPDTAPKRVRMLRPYGFHDDTGHRFWRHGAIVENADDIALLIVRGAAYEVLE